MKKFGKILLGVLFLALLGGTFWFLYNNSRPKELTYSVQKAAIATIEKSTTIAGKIEPRTEIAIKPQISGIISEILRQPGDVVQVGDVIAKIQVIPDPSAVSNAENRLTIAQMSLEQTKREYDRMTELKNKGYVSGEEWEQSRLAFSKASEEIAAAKENLSIAREGVSMKYASQSNTLVRATINGVILDIPMKKGNSVIMANNFNDGTTIATIADMNDLIFRGSIDETEIGFVRKGMEMNISIGALPNVSLTAHLEYISPKSVENNGANTFEIKAAIVVDKNAMGSSELRAGYSANAQIVLEKAENVVTVPEYCVEYEGNDAYVFVASDSLQTTAFTRTPVQTGISNGVNIEIKNGIEANTFVRGKQK